MQPFEQVMAQDMIVRYAPRHAAMQGGDIIDALAHINAGSEEVLIDVGHRAAVDINRSVAAVKMGEMRSLAELGQYLDPGLQDGMPGYNPTALQIDDSSVERMRQNADKARGGLWRHLGVCIQCDRIPDPAQGFHGARHQIKCTFVFSFFAQDVAVELMKLATLAFPRHPAAFDRIMLATTVHQQKSWPCF